VTSSQQPDDQLNRRSFIGRTSTAAAFSLASGRAAGDGHPTYANELEEVSLSELAEGLANSRMTSRSLVTSYFDSIERIDRRGPAINSILELNPDALAIADRLDEERRTRGPRSRLHGIPVLIKDNIGTADRMHTSAGSLALAESIAPRDAFIVERLRAAGMIILGKGNMTEWANARGRNALGGWSGRGRLTRNPYALDRSAGGSSSGMGAAVSASLAPVAIGTETIGSIVSPAAMCGIVGLKPTVGLVSRAGIIPVSYSQDTAGPMGRSVRDVAMLLNVIAAPDPADPYTTRERGPAVADYTASLDPGGLRGARIGVARNLFGHSLLADRVAERALESLRAAGAVLVDPVNIETYEAIWGFCIEVLSYELKASLNEYLASLGPNAPVRSLADIIAFNLRHSDRELAWFGQETFEYAQSKGPLTSREYTTALTMMHRLTRNEGIDQAITANRLDAIVAPTQSPAWLSDILLGDNTLLGSFLPAAAAGYPSISVPAGDVVGLPVGLLFFGRAWSEATLLRLAYAFEQRTRARRVPTFQVSITPRP